MFVHGTHGILKDPDIIFADENEKGTYDIFAENENYITTIYEDIKKSDLKRIMIKLYNSILIQEINNENSSNF